MAYPYPSYNGFYNPNYTGYFPQSYQPVSIPQVSQPAQQTTQNTFQWVQGEAGAKAYPVAPGNSVLLMDSESATIYWKSTDQSGRPLPMKTYDLVERAENADSSAKSVDVQFDASSFVKQDELAEKVADLVEKEVRKRIDNLQFKTVT